MRSRAILLPRRHRRRVGEALEVGVDLRRDVDGQGLDAEALGDQIGVLQALRRSRSGTAS